MLSVMRSLMWLTSDLSTSSSVTSCSFSLRWKLWIMILSYSSSNSLMLYYFYLLRVLSYCIFNIDISSFDSNYCFYFIKVGQSALLSSMYFIRFFNFFWLPFQACSVAVILDIYYSIVFNCSLIVWCDLSCISSSLDKSMAYLLLMIGSGSIYLRGSYIILSKGYET